MPYEIVENSPDCPDARSYAVMKQGTTELMGCHATREEAQAQMAALYANEPTMREGQ